MVVEEVLPPHPDNMIRNARLKNAANFRISVTLRIKMEFAGIVRRVRIRSCDTCLSELVAIRRPLAYAP